MIELFGSLWVQNWCLSYFLCHCCFFLLHNSSVRIGSALSFLTYLVFIPKFLVSVTFRTLQRRLLHHLIELLKFRNNNSRVIATIPGDLLWKMWIWAFFNIMLCFHFSLVAVLQGMAKGNPTTKQIDTKIQATLKHAPAWKLTEEEM